MAEKAISRAACILACLVFAGCATTTVAAGPEEASAPSVAHSETLYVWSADASFADEVLEGCRYWSVAGIRCVLVSERLKADVRFDIRAYPGDLSTSCVKVARALAHQDGKVEVDLDLFMDGKAVNRKRLVATIAHETGHELGLNHLPLSCETPEPSAEAEDDDGCGVYDPGPVALPDGTMVCGLGIMNAPRTVDLPRLTEGDLRAFRLRDPDWRKTDPPRLP